METNELRIGNVLSDGKFRFVVESIEHDMLWGNLLECIKPDRIEDFYDEGVYHFDIKNVNGILLTEEWLLKLGFKKRKFAYVLCNTNEIKDDYDIRVKFTEKKDEFYLNYGYHEQFIGYYKYVHQLQNLYFILTGNELEIK
jgi:hypothetical protein